MHRTSSLVQRIGVAAWLALAGASCGLDTEGVSNCGDGLVGLGEECDGSDLGGADCASLGLGEGALACAANCTLEGSGCVPAAACGNGVREKGETCDGADLGGATCDSVGKSDGGFLACGADCASWDTGGCFVVAVCGDGAVGGDEECDGAELGGLTCAALGFDGGVLGCSAGCVLDASACRVCGNGIREAGEACDGADTAGADCTTIGQGFVGGALGCNAYCAFFDPGACTAPSGCGDGVLDAAEACDGVNVAGVTCEAEGYVGGVMDCYGGCVLDRTACTGRPLDRDFNGDGYDDLVVGAVNAIGSGTLAEPTGAAYVYFGGPGATLDATIDGALLGESAADYFGGFVAAAGDLNGDGFGDVVIGATGGGPAALPTTTGPGRAYVYLGGPGLALDATPDGVLTGEAMFDQFGAGVAGAGDFNADGFDDLVVGAPTWGAVSSTIPGRAYLYFGGPGAAFDETADLTFDTSAPGPVEFGWDVAGASDVNGDGYDDVLVGSRIGGEARLYLGGPPTSLDAVADAVLVSDPALAGLAETQFGRAVASAGDVNADGFADVVVGAPTTDVTGNHMGAAYVYYGGPGAAFDATADGVVTGTADLERAGKFVGGGGDVNGDGFDDVVVGDATWEASLYLGGPGGFDTEVDAVLTGESVALADVNADGFADVVLGSEVGLSTSPGRVDVYLGGAGAAFDTTADAFLSGPELGAQFGVALGRASEPPAPAERIAIAAGRRRRFLESG